MRVRVPSWAPKTPSTFLRMSKTHTSNIVGTPEIVPYPNRFESAKPHLTIWQEIRKATVATIIFFAELAQLVERRYRKP